MSTELPKEVVDMVERVVKGETTLQQEMGITDKELEAIYAIAYTQYMSGKYEDARKTFNILLMFNPLSYKYCFGLASTYKMLKETELASVFFTFACSLEPDNPEPYIHLAECLIQLGDLMGAKVNLERALELAQANEKNKAAGDRAKVLLESVEAKLEH